SMNGAWGELLAEVPEVGMILHNDFSINLSENWNADNIGIVVLVIDSETYEVFQAEEISIK
ncbi:MAG TPA: hypothetical protein VK994_05110, partial [Bacteroidales bacterium]|nr:hypothetical protein [Bacteroidales bacterium]